MVLFFVEKKHKKYKITEKKLLNLTKRCAMMFLRERNRLRYLRNKNEKDMEVASCSQR